MLYTKKKEKTRFGGGRRQNWKTKKTKNLSIIRQCTFQEQIILRLCPKTKNYKLNLFSPNCFLDTNIFTFPFFPSPFSYFHWYKLYIWKPIRTKMQFKQIIIAVTTTVAAVSAANNSSSSTNAAPQVAQLGTAGAVGAIAAGAIAFLI